MATVSSCANEENANIKTDAEVINTSAAFQSLGVSTTELNMNNIQRETPPAGYNLLILSFKNSGNKILNVLDEKGFITVSTLVSVESTIPSKDYNDAFNAKAFQGK
jgi:hypothetical protein